MSDNKQKTYAGGSDPVALTPPMSVAELMALSELFWGLLWGRDRSELVRAESKVQSVMDRAEPLREDIARSGHWPTPSQAMESLQGILDLPRQQEDTNSHSESVVRKS